MELLPAEMLWAIADEVQSVSDLRNLFLAYPHLYTLSKIKRHCTIQTKDRESYVYLCKCKLFQLYTQIDLRILIFENTLQQPKIEVVFDTSPGTFLEVRCGSSKREYTRSSPFSSTPSVKRMEKELNRWEGIYYWYPVAEDGWFLPECEHILQCVLKSNGSLETFLQHFDVVHFFICRTWK